MNIHLIFGGVCLYISVTHKTERTMDIQKEIQEKIYILALLNDANEVYRRPSIERLQMMCVEGGWKLIEDDENTQTWIRHGYEITIYKTDSKCRLDYYIPYGTMKEVDRVRYFNETYMKERGKRGIITDLDQVEWGALKAREYSEEFEYVFADYLLR